MIINLPEELIRKILNKLEIKDLGKILKVNKSIYDLNYKKFMFPLYLSNQWLSDEEDIGSCVQYLHKEYDYTLKEYLIDIKNTYEDYIGETKTTNNMYFREYGYKFGVHNTDLFKEKKKQKLDLHIVYRVTKIQYKCLRRRHLNILALIY